MTVFLTTQYLEEADVLADRVGIIDRGKIVAEGTPDAAEGGDRQPDRRGRPRRRRRRASALAELLGALRQARAPRRGAVAVQLPRRRDRARRDRPRARPSDLHVATLQLHEPSLDDVFLAKTGRKLEGAGDDEDAEARQPACERGLARRVAALQRAALLEQVGAVARRSVMRTLRQRALLVFPLVFPLILFAINAQRRSAPATQDPRASRRQLPRLRARGPLHAGRAVRRDHRGHRPRPRHRDRLLRPAGADAAARRGAARRPARRRARRSACVQALVYLLVGLATGVGIASGVGGALVLLALSIADRVRLRAPRRAAGAAVRHRRSGPGLLPAAVRDCSSSARRTCRAT